MGVGHPLTVLKTANYPGAGTYEIPTSMGTASSYSIGNGQRSQFGEDGGKSPGPAHYMPSDCGITAHEKAAVFGSCERRHECEDVDPDEPPGPGTHKLKSALSTRSPGLPTAAKGKTVVGMGPVGYPSPGDYCVDVPRKAGKTIHLPCPRQPEIIPGPTDYDPSVHLGHEAAPEPGPIAPRTAPRKSPFDMGNSSGRDKASDAILRRAAAAAAEAAEREGYGDPHAARLAFAASGPKYSMYARRPQVGAKTDHCQTMYGPRSSMG